MIITVIIMTEFVAKYVLLRDDMIKKIGGVF